MLPIRLSRLPRAGADEAEGEDEAEGADEGAEEDEAEDEVEAQRAGLWNPRHAAPTAAPAGAQAALAHAPPAIPASGAKQVSYAQLDAKLDAKLGSRASE